MPTSERVKEYRRQWKAAKRAANPEWAREQDRKYRERAGDERRQRNRDYWKDKPEKYLLTSARTRAKTRGLPFSITEEDIVIPEFCPILGIKLEKRNEGKKGPQEASPSLDRIRPELGYVPGNVAVISFRANRMKQLWPLEELERLTTWLRSQLEKTA